MPRQFGLKRVAATKKFVSAAATGSAPAITQHTAGSELATSGQGALQPKPLYAPASWRGCSHRRCVSAG